MSQNDLPLDERHFERLLRARLEVLRRQIGEALLRRDTEAYAELAGQVHDAEEQALADLLSDVNLAEISRDVYEIRDVDAALRRIAARRYGTCLDCAERIDPARLESYPTAKRCLQCQRAYEARAHSPRPPSL